MHNDQKQRDMLQDIKQQTYLLYQESTVALELHNSKYQVFMLTTVTEISLMNYTLTQAIPLLEVTI